MYIGGTDEHGLFVIVREPSDNGVDEYLAGRNKFVAIMIDKDGSFWVQDGGLGIPQGVKVVEINLNGKTVTSKMPTMQAVFGELHTSGKFRSDAYATSIGSHGVGVKGTNATSEYMDVVTCYKGAWYTIGFKHGRLTTPVGGTNPPKSPFSGKTLTKGTLIHFKPDPKIFSVKSFPASMLLEWAETQAYLNAGLQVVVNIRGKQKSFLTQDGPKAFIEKKLVDLKADAETTYFLDTNELANVAVAFSNADGFHLQGFTNGLSNPNGGKHVDSVSTALFKALVPYKAAKQEFTASDFRDGLVGMVNAKLHKAAFSSQDKAKLTDDRMGAAFEATMFETATKFWQANKAMAKRICDRATKINELKTKFKASKAVASELNKLKRIGLPANYAPAHSSVPIKDRELFIVEGDSAAGGIRKVRAPNQALLPLTGKILNVLRSKGDRALLSVAILNILAAIGYDTKQAEPLKKLQVGRVILLSDADPDGPLRGSTKVKLLDGTTKTMKQLASIWAATQEPFWVWGVKADGSPIPTLGYNPRAAVYVDEAFELTLDDGTKFVCSPRHRWAVNYAAHTAGSVHDYVHHVRAQHLQVGDSLVSIPFDVYGRSDRPYTRLLVNGKMVPAHQRVKQVLQPKNFRKYKALNKGSGIGGAVHIHHKDDNSLNNTPENLHFLYKESHGRSHLREYAAVYNGSKKHLRDLSRHWKSANGEANRIQASTTITAYNKSPKHKATVALQNKDPRIIRLQQLAKCARYYADLIAANKGMTDWDNYLPTSMPIRKNLTFTPKELLAFIRINRKSVQPRSLVPTPAHEYPTQKITKFLRTCQKVLRETSILTEGTYNAYRADWVHAKKIPRGTPKWQTVFPLLRCKLRNLPALVRRESNNHKIVKIRKIVCDNEPMYCMTVPETSNFLLEDIHGNGVASGNSHINCLEHALFSRYLPGMYDLGMICVADMPEFYAISKDQIFTGDSLSDVQKKLAKAKVKADVLHAKGWGEVDAQVLKVLAVEKTRRLIRMKPLSASDLQVFNSLMGKAEIVDIIKEGDNGD